MQSVFFCFVFWFGLSFFVWYLISKTAVIPLALTNCLDVPLELHQHHIKLHPHHLKSVQEIEKVCTRLKPRGFCLLLILWPSANVKATKWCKMIQINSIYKHSRDEKKMVDELASNAYHFCHTQQSDGQWLFSWPGGQLARRTWMIRYINMLSVWINTLKSKFLPYFE